VAALGHPLRLSLLRLLLDGEHTVAQLVDELELASTGVAYHHLNQLQSAGWVTSPHRGVWSVPATRVIPLLVIITALEEA
jgi:DNA-binding transcriptional ArsR family regulator